SPGWGSAPAREEGRGAAPGGYSWRPGGAPQGHRQQFVFVVDVKDQCVDIVPCTVGRGSITASSNWERDLFGKLVSFADVWQSFEGTERSGAQEYLQSLLDIYGASFRPGTIFEQHPMLVPERGTRGAQSSLFP